MKQTKRLLLVLLALTLSITTACKPADSSSFRGTPDASQITVNLPGSPPELNSMLATDAVSADILRVCMSGLFKLDQNDQPQPDLVETWEVSADNKTYTMHLRADALWSSGDPVTAADFIFAWTYAMNAANASPYSFLLYENIKNGQAFYEGKVPAADLGIKALDASTLQVELEQPIPYALTLFASFIYLPVNQKAFEAIGAENYGKSPETFPTNGAYRMTEWTRDDHILVTKNEAHYNAANIFIPQIRFTMITDTNAALNAFRAGELDTANITGEQMLQLEQESAKNVQKYYDNGTWFLRFNTQSKLLSNAKLRQALGMAIDVQQLCDNVLKDGSVPADGYVPPRIAGAGGKLYAEARGSIHAPKTADAKALWDEGLRELGVDAADVTLRYLADDTTYSKMQAEYFQAQWKQNLGLDVQVDSMPFKARLAATSAGDFDIVFGGWSPDFNDPMTFLSLFTSQSSNNSGHYENAQYDDLIARAMAERDELARQKLLIEAETLLLQDAPIAPLYFSCVPYVVSDKLTGITRTGFQEYDFCDGAQILPPQG